MNTPPLTPGTLVDVEIRGAKVVGVDGQFVDVEYGASNVTFPHRTRILTDRIGVTVTPAAVTPQAGQVWEGVRLNEVGETGRKMWITLDGAYTTSGYSRYKLSDLDFTNARCVYPQDAGREAELEAEVQRLRTWATELAATAGVCPHCGDSGTDHTGCGRESDGRSAAGVQAEAFGCDRCQDTGSCTHCRGGSGDGASCWECDGSHVCPCSQAALRPLPATSALDEDETAGSGEVPMLRRFEDRYPYRHCTVWTETAPGSGLYNFPARAANGHPPLKRPQVKACYGIAQQLDPVPAAATDGGAA